MSRTFVIGLLLCAMPVAAVAQQPPAAKTRIVVLGVTHSNQLLAESYQPAVFRAFFDRVRPVAVCVERDPEAFSRGSHHEFTYEIQHIALPWAAERGVPVHPFDWYAPAADELLGMGLSWDPPPLVRRRGAPHAFLTYRDSAALRLPFFYAESDSVRKDYRDWYDAVPQEHATDFPRRLFLYRTFLQARRVAHAAAGYPGKTVLVVVGSYHTEDIERILAEDPRFELVKPSSFGLPGADEVERQTRREDLFAIATFNLLSVQSRQGPVDWPWVRRVLERLAREGRTSEVELLETRLGVLTGTLTPAAAAARYEELARRAGAEARFTWDGVRDRSRVDSYVDPFGNLTVGQRALLEAAREHAKLGHAPRAAELRKELEAKLTPLQRMQLAAYWEDHLAQAR
ncbi:MAG TPA: hypothetical protein VFX98_10045 [Longimicrobiaceae bacterium]|nr:hypothetical protein [Longimicrobiaceae bacterium]